MQRNATSGEAQPQAQQLLDRMIAVYRRCQTYADNAIYRERWVLRQEGAIREPPPQMVSVSFARPAQLRVTRRVPDEAGGVGEEYTILSTGSRMYHTLPQYPRQVLETVAPIELSADIFASAPQVAEDLLFVPLEDSFPQLDMLLSEKPQDDALSGEAKPELLEDALLGERPCYRVAQNTNAGRRVYWIDKESHLLRRLDLPAGKIREALDRYDDLQHFERWIEFADAVVDRELPDEAFELDLPESAVVVRNWVRGYPGPEPSGPEVSEEERKLYWTRLARYEAELAAASDSAEQWQAEFTPTEIAAATQPQSFRLERAWGAEGLASPGNVLVVDDAAGPRIFAIDDGTVVVELGLDGRLIQQHGLDGLGDERVSHLRSFAATDGQRWFAVTGPGQRRVHLFGSNWELKWSFPQQDHPGIGDVTFAPFGPSSAPQLVVGFWGDLGVHGVSLEGEREWVDRSLQQVLDLTLASDDQQNPVVWTAHGREVIGRVGKDGPLPPLFVSGRPIVEVAAEDLDGDGKQEYCGIAFAESGVYDVVGLDATGRELWSYSLPKGEFRTPTQRIATSRGGPDAAWLIPAADGSVHLLAVDGRQMDRFNYGQAISGIGCAEHEDQRLLLVASSEGLSAWRIVARE